MNERMHSRLHRIAALGLTAAAVAALAGAGGAPVGSAYGWSGDERANGGHEHGPAGAPASEARDHAWEQPPAQAAFRVADRATNVEPDRLGVELVAPDPRLAAEAAEAIAATVRLVRADGEEVPIDTFFRVAPRGEDGRVPASVDIDAGDLPEGWYRLELAEIPRGVHFHGDREPVPLGQGAAARFRIGSAPLLRGLVVCEKEDGARVIRLDSSEPLLAPGLGVGDLVSVEVPGGACAAASLRAGVVERLDEPRRRLDLRCDGLPDGATAQVRIRRGLHSAGGKLLGPRSLQVALPSADELAASPEGCAYVPIE